MPDNTVRYYPVLARILMRLGEGSIVCYRGTVVTQPSRLVVDHDLMHRIVTEYKGQTETCDMNNARHMEHRRTTAVENLERRCQRKSLPHGAQYEPTTEIVIDLRGAELSTVG